MTSQSLCNKRLKQQLICVRSIIQICLLLFCNKKRKKVGYKNKSKNKNNNNSTTNVIMITLLIKPLNQLYKPSNLYVIIITTLGAFLRWSWITR